jgi:hypothetical protein
MPYARKNWTTAEVERALANPSTAAKGPAAHSHIHAVSGELANHPLFQKARVTAEIYEYNKKGKIVHGPDAKVHSTLSAAIIAAGVVKAFNKDQLQPYLAILDRGLDMKVKVNFIKPLGFGYVHQTGNDSKRSEMRGLFIYCKPNPSNKDLPIFQTVVPYSTAFKHGEAGDPVFLV